MNHEVVCHTGMPLTTPLRDGGEVIDYLTPFPFPFLDGVDLRKQRNFPQGRGMYATRIDRAWVGLHDIREKRGFVKTLDPRTKGVKYYTDSDHSEIFTGITRSLEHYRIMNPRDSAGLVERIIPTTGMTWVSTATRDGIAGLYITDDTLAGEAILIGPAYKKVRIAVTCGGKLLSEREIDVSPGQLMKVNAKAPAESRASSCGLSVYHAGRKLIEFSSVLDSLPVFNGNRISEPPLDSTIARQASSKLPAELEDAAEAMLSGAGIEGVSSPLLTFAPPVRPGKSRRPPSPLNHLVFKKGGNAVAVGRKTYLLTQGSLVIIADKSERKPAGITYGVNSLEGHLLDTACFKPGMFPFEKVSIENAEWHTDIMPLGERLVLALEKRVEVRDLDGKLLDTINIGEWVGNLESVDGARILVTLPYSNSLALIDLGRRTVEKKADWTCWFQLPLGYHPNPGRMGYQFGPEPANTGSGFHF